MARGDALLAPSVTRRLLDRFVDALPGAGRSAGASTSSPSGSSRCCAWWRWRCPTPRSPRGSSLTEATVKTHVSADPAQARLRDRVQAVVFAYDSGLVRPRSS